MLRIAFLGTPEITLPLLEACREVGELACLIAQPDRPVGRSSQPQPPPSKRWALERGVPVHQPLKVKSGALAALLRESRADLAVVAAYGRILPKDALETPRLGCINVHASLLPLLRGAAPAQWAIALGHAKSGVTLMQMDEGLDTGDLLLQRMLELAPDETAESLLPRLGALGAAMLHEALPLLERGELARTPQEHARATLAPILRKEDGRVDWSRTAREIDARRRGFTPWPGATALLEGAPLKLHATYAEPEAISQEGASPGPEAAAPGALLAATRSGLLVACGAGTRLRITELQPEGRRRMTAEAFLAGHPLGPGARFS